MSDRPVVLAHPISQHAYEAAVGLDAAALLHRFVTGVYRTPALARVERVLPAGGRAWLGRRAHPELDPARVRLVPGPQLAWVALRGAAARRQWDGEWWMFDRFDAVVARRLPRSVRLVHAFEGSALRTLRRARAAGAVAVLDAPSAHEAFHAAERACGLRPFDTRTERIRAERDEADWVLVGSAWAAERIAEAGADPERLLVLPYGADPARFAPPAGGRAGRSALRVVFAGEVGPRKGAPELLAAWRALAPTDAELVLAGAIHPALRDAVAAAGPSVRALGVVPGAELPALFAAADVFVLPSHAEGFARSALDAMAAGLPVVLTPETGEAARDGTEGLLVPAGDADALAAALSRLLGCEALRLRLGAAGRERVLAGFTWADYRRRLAAVHRALLAGEDPRAALAAGHE